MIRTRASTLSTSSEVRSRIAARRFGRLDGFAYQSPPPSYWRRAIVSGEARRAFCAERRANAVTVVAPSNIAAIPSPILFALRSALNALRIPFLIRDLVRLIPRDTELRDQLSDHVASTASLGGQYARTRAHIRFFNGALLRARQHDHDLTPRRRFVIVRAEHAHRSPTYLLVLLCHFAGHCDFFLPRADRLEIRERLRQPRRRLVHHSSMWQGCELGERRRALASFPRKKTIEREAFGADARGDERRQQRRRARNRIHDNPCVDRR